MEPVRRLPQMLAAALPPALAAAEAVEASANGGVLIGAGGSGGAVAGVSPEQVQVRARGGPGGRCGMRPAH